MKIFKNSLLQCPLFKGISFEDIEHIMQCFALSPYRCNADDYVILSGDQVNYVYIILEGSVELMKETYSGSRHIIAILGPSHMFGEGIVCTSHRISPVTVRTKEPTVLLKFSYQKIMKPCSNVCGFHTRLIFNMMLLLGDKNYVLNQKMELLMLKGMREKLATYLLSEKQRNNCDKFAITMNRNELADYLNVSRPSMSRELGRMREEGIIDYHKNNFRLLDLERLTECAEACP